MLGDFITRCLVLILGYAYPALECYKTVEKNRVEIEELRFWCQYWIIVAMLTVLERIGDIFISWVPMYGELKLALFIYLWYPKTKGSGYVYDAVLRPYVSKHETDIDRKLQEWRLRAWDLAIFYYQNCSQLGQSAFFQVVEYLAGQSARFKHPHTQKKDDNNNSSTQHPPPNVPTFNGAANGNGMKWPPIPSAPPLPGSTTIDRSMAEPPKPNLVQVLLHQQKQRDQQSEPSRATSPTGLKFRRSKPHH
ncbi:hypothetical protein ACB092_09G069800 [Castanea dentata]